MRSQVVVGGKSDGADEASVVADAPAGRSGLSVADLDGVDEVMQMLQGSMSARTARLAKSDKEDTAVAAAVRSLKSFCPDLLAIMLIHGGVTELGVNTVAQRKVAKKFFGNMSVSVFTMARDEYASSANGLTLGQRTCCQAVAEVVSLLQPEVDTSGLTASAGPTPPPQVVSAAMLKKMEAGNEMSVETGDSAPLQQILSPIQFCTSMTSRPNLAL